MALTFYSCAAKHKSSKAFRGDSVLFEQLSGVVIYTATDISTKLVLEHPAPTLSVRSQRSFLHHELTNGLLRIYVPQDVDQRRSCYRSQLPRLLADLLDVGPSAMFNLTNIISASPLELESVLSEQDISQVGWIQKPILMEADEDAHSLGLASDESDAETLVRHRYRSESPAATPPRHGRPHYSFVREEYTETIRPSQYPELIERVVRSAHRASVRYLGNEVGASDDHQHFNYNETFGANDAIAWRRIGAAGEAYVCFSDDVASDSLDSDPLFRYSNFFADSVYLISLWRTGKVRSVACSPLRRTLMGSRTG